MALSTGSMPLLRSETQVRFFSSKVTLTICVVRLQEILAFQTPLTMIEMVADYHLCYRSPRNTKVPLLSLQIATQQ